MYSFCCVELFHSEINATIDMAAMLLVFPTKEPTYSPEQSTDVQFFFHKLYANVFDKKLTFFFLDRSCQLLNNELAGVYGLPGKTDKQ